MQHCDHDSRITTLPVSHRARRGPSGGERVHAGAAPWKWSECTRGETANPNCTMSVPPDSMCRAAGIRAPARVSRRPSPSMTPEKATRSLRSRESNVTTSPSCSSCSAAYVSEGRPYAAATVAEMPLVACKRIGASALAQGGWRLHAAYVSRLSDTRPVASHLLVGVWAMRSVRRLVYACMVHARVRLAYWVTRVSVMCNYFGVGNAIVRGLRLALAGSRETSR